jgi:hypothetical protein
LGRRRRVILPRRPGVWCCGGAGILVHLDYRTPSWQPRARVQPLRLSIWFSHFAWPACAIHAQRALCSRSGAGHRGGAVGQAAPRHFAASAGRVVLRRCGGPSASKIEDPILAAQNSSATLKVFHLVFAFRMASVRYPRTARIVQPQWGRPQGERSNWAGGAASFCHVAWACGAAMARGSECIPNREPHPGSPELECNP